MSAKIERSLEGLRHAAGATKRTVRKHLDADSSFLSVKKDFQKIPDKRRSNSKIALDDALMSALAMFQLKGPPLFLWLPAFMFIAYYLWCSNSERDEISQNSAPNQ